MMAAKRGRPKHDVSLREPNGRASRAPPTLTQIKEAEAAEREKDRQSAWAVALAQPHRRGSGSPWCATALGRFCLAHKLSESLYNAGEAYSKVMRQWRAAKGVPMQVSLGGAGSPDGPAASTVKAWWEEIKGIEGALSKHSMCCLIAIRHLVIDDAELPHEISSVCIDGLMILAKHRGTAPKHPYQ